MKKVYLTAFMPLVLLHLFLLGLVSASAQDTLTVNNPSRVRVVTSPTTQEVEIFGSASDSTYYFSSSIATDDQTIRRTRERLSAGLDFSLPLIGSDEDVLGGREPFGRIDLSLNAGFGVVFPAHLTDDTYGPMRSAWGLDFTMSLIQCEIHPWRGKTHFYLDFGLEDRSFKIREDQMYVKDDAGVLGLAPVTGDLKWSALRLFSWNLSFGYQQHIHDDLYISFGPVINFNTGGRIKTKWSDDEGRHKEKVKFGHRNLVTYELMGRIHFKDEFSVYVKYNPCSMFEKGYGPDFTTWSVGIIL